mgnify:CR=1 FL=1
MTKEETLKVINEIIDDSAKSMKENAVKMLDKNFDFDLFGDRNSFARIAWEILVNNEIPQYKYNGNRREKKFIELCNRLKYNLMYHIHFD